MDTPDRNLEARIERLERLVQELHQRLPSEARDEAEVPRSPTGAPAAACGTEAPASAEARLAGTAGAATATAGPARRLAGIGGEWRRWIWDSELWLNKLGIALVLFGVTFLFRYSIEQGWLTPAVRVAIGLLVGSILLGAGLRLAGRQRSFAQVLMGGGIATFYIVGFAAFQLYALVGYATAFGFMVAVTVAAFALAMRADHPVLSLIGVKGALGTPFLLYSGDGHFPWLVAFTCLVVAAAVGLYLYRGWRSVLWTAFAGGWAVLAVAYWTDIAGLAGDAAGKRWILQSAVLFCWAVFAVAPPLQEWRSGLLSSGSSTPAHLRAAAYLIAILSPSLAVTYTGSIWSMSSAAWGGLVVTVAAAYAAAGLVLRRESEDLGAAHLLAAALLLPAGTTAAISGDRLYLALAAQATAMHWLAGRLHMRSTAAVANLVFAGIATWFVVRLDVAGIANTGRALVDLLVLGLALLAALWIAVPRARFAYRLAVHGALLAWFWRELAVLPHGAAWVSVAWCGYGVMLLVAGLRRRSDALQKTALATLLLMVAKLFVIDLAALEAIWRILLFLGLGGGFLVASYLLQGLWDERARALGR